MEHNGLQIGNYPLGLLTSEKVAWWPLSLVVDHLACGSAFGPLTHCCEWGWTRTRLGSCAKQHEGGARSPPRPLTSSSLQRPLPSQCRSPPANTFSRPYPPPPAKKRKTPRACTHFLWLLVVLLLEDTSHVEASIKAKLKQLLQNPWLCRWFDRMVEHRLALGGAHLAQHSGTILVAQAVEVKLEHPHDFLRPKSPPHTASAQPPLKPKHAGT